MGNEVKIGIISGVLTTIVLGAGASYLGVFEKKLTDSQIQEVARLIVDDHPIRETLLEKMEKSGKFKDEIKIDDKSINTLVQKLSTDENFTHSLTKELVVSKQLIETLHADTRFRGPAGPKGDAAQAVTNVRIPEKHYVFFDGKNVGNLSVDKKAKLVIHRDSVLDKDGYFFLNATETRSLAKYGKDFRLASRFSNFGRGEIKGFYTDRYGKTSEVYFECASCEFTDDPNPRY
ncbi:MAG: hypothetical protein ACRBB6_02875 [Neptuniibacter sp.]